MDAASKTSAPLRPEAHAARPEVAARIQLRTLRRRRWRVVRSMLLLLVSFGVIVILTNLSRDEAAIRTCAMRMDAAREALQQRFDVGLPPAPQLPLPAPDVDGGRARQLVEELRGSVDYNVLDPLQQRRGVPEIGIVCDRSPHTRLIGATGRYVIVFDTQARRYLLRWMDEGDFTRHALELGFYQSVRHN